MCGSLPALEVLYAHYPGGEIVGVLSALLTTLQASLCPTSYGYLFACAEYTAVRLQLWTQLGAAVCGFPADAWNGTARVRDMTAAQAMEFLLSQCIATYTGDLAGLVDDATTQFMTLSSRARPDVSAVLAANAAKAGLPVDTSGVVTAQDNPPIIPNLAPVPALGRQPAVLTAQVPPDVYEYVPSNPALLTEGLFGQYLVPQLATLAFPDLSSTPDATAQDPAKLAAAVQEAAAGTALYQAMYLAHPSPAAHFDASFCAAAAWNDDRCFPTLRPAVGVTVDAYGNRLLTDRGQAVPPGTPDAAGVVPPAGTVVPPGTFYAPLRYQP